ncbi:MAG TPA: class F sortase [Planosporangium sp.]|nr:class F sortase [Planosporangium sp.]
MRRRPDAPTRGSGGRRGSPRRAAGGAFVAATLAVAALAVAVVVLTGVGTGLLAASFNAPPRRPPQPVAQAAPPGLDSAAAALSGPAGSRPAPGMPAPGMPAPGTPRLARSDPTRITIPRIGVAAEIMSVGLDKDDRVQPPPLEKAKVAGWYGPGPSPGEIGSAVIVGHVDSRTTGPAVFFRLGALVPGDTIQVTRKDGTAARFTVDGVKAYPKTDFPTDLVYGPADKARLRLVTCGGRFDGRDRSYSDNVIVFATLAPVVQGTVLQGTVLQGTVLQSTNESVHS